MNTQTIVLNLVPGGIPPVVHVSQYDVGRPLAFELYDGLSAATIEAGTVIDIRATKPDGTGFEYACTWNNNVVSIATQAQMTVLSGSIECELHLVKDSQEIGTANFILEVEAAALRGDTDISETDLPDIIDMARSHEQAAASSASDAEAYAVGKRGGVNVTSGDPAYENNSKYYAGEADDSATAAATSESNAATSESNAEAYAVGKRGGVDVTSGDPAYENNSKYYAGEADDSATAAATSESNAATSESNAEAYAIGKRGGVDVTSGDPAYENNSKYYAGEAATSKSDSEAYAVGKRGGIDVPNTDPTFHNNAKYYKEIAEQAAAGGLIPQGTIAFADLPALSSTRTGYMWNISDAFTTTSEFVEGAGARHGAGANVYKTASGYWDVTGGQRVEMTGATSNTDGTAGELPAPLAGEQNAVLKGDGSWDTDVVNNMAFRNIIPTEFYKSVNAYGLNCIYNDDGTFTINGTATEQHGSVLTTGWFSDASAFKPYIGRDVIFLYDSDDPDMDIRIVFYDANNEAVLGGESKRIVTIPSTIEYFVIHTWIEAGKSFTNVRVRPVMIAVGDFINVLKNARSYVGMIVQSTTLDTEAKVKAFYGGTTWIQHSGYMLRGATSSVTANSQSNDGGADSVSYTPQGSNSGGSVGNTAISVNQMPSHTHKFQGFYQTAYASGDPCISRYKMSGDPQETGPMLNTGGSQNHNHGFTNPKFTGTAATINTLPEYKNVYIWERTA